MRKSQTRPGVEERLVLLSAGTLARRQSAQGQIDELAALADWSLLAELLRERRLLPLLGPRLMELVGDRVGDQFAVTVTQALDAGRRQGAFLQLITERVVASLAEAGIRCTPLKGPPLSEALYGDPGRRPSGDIDLLVAQEQLLDAVEVVRGLEYGAPTDYVEECGLPLLHFALVHERDLLPPVELHWRIHWYEREFARDRLLVPSDDLAGAWRPAPGDELIALLLFYARDGFLSLRHAVDLGAWWDAFGATLPPGALDGALRAYPALVPVLSAALRVAEKTVGFPAGRLTGGEPKLGARGRIAVRLADPLPRSSPAQIYADMGLVDGLLAPPGGFYAFLRRQVTPSRAAIEGRAQTAQGWGANSTLGHSVRVLSRYVLAMTHLLRLPLAVRSR